MSIAGYGQLTVSIYGEGCKFISAAGIPQGQCYSIGFEGMYTKYTELREDEKRSDLGFHIRGGFKIMPLEIFSEQFYTNIRYTESVFYVGLGGVSVLSEKYGDELYYFLQIGQTTVSKSLYFAFKTELQGVNLNRRKKWNYNLCPFLSIGAYRGWRNYESYHLQILTGISFKL